MGDPYFDLASVSISFKFNDSQDEDLLHAYSNGPVTDEMRAYIFMYKIIHSIAWALKELEIIQLGFSFQKPDEIVLEQVKEYVRNSKQLIESKYFQKYLKLLQAL